MSDQTDREQLLAPTLPPGGVFLNVLGSELHDSPFQYRKTYNEAALEELATSIRETGGIHQPLLVRRRFPNPLRTQYEPENGFEIVSGHRRKIAGGRAMLPLFPILVKDLTNDQVRRIQITENLQREDVHAIEEAEGFQTLIDAGDTADQLADQFGKSRSYIYGRLKLLQACPRIRQACLQGKIGTEVALLIARLRTPKLQEKALSRIEGKYYSLEDGGSKSFRNIRDLLAEHFTLDLKKPMFDQADALLVPAAGACGDCPKRVGNAPEYADLMTKADHAYASRKFAGNPDVCTDPDCYEEKKKAHLRNEAARLEQAGKVVIDGAKARAAVGVDGKVKGAYIALSDVKRELATAKKTGAAPEIVTIQDPRSGKTVQAVKRADLVAAGVKDVAPKQDLEAERLKRQAAHEREQAAVKAEQSARLNVLRAIREKVQATERSAFDMVLIARTAFAGVDYWPKQLLEQLWETDDVDGQIDTMTTDELLLFMFDCALIGECRVSYVNEPQVDLLKVAAYYGVDVQVARGDAAADGTPPPSTAARAPKEAKGKATTAKSTKRAKTPTAAAVDLVGDAIDESQSLEAGSAGEKAKDEPADADLERDPNTSDMFEGEPANV